jgi:hypothetical protein
LGQRRAGALQVLGALVQGDLCKRQVDRGGDRSEEEQAALPPVAPSPPGVRIVDGVQYYSSAWLDSTRPVLAEAGTDG